MQLFGAVMLLMLPCTTRAEVISAPGYKIKAGFIYNFAKLTQWPTNASESDSSPIKIGVVGSGLLADYLDDEVKGRFIDGRKVTVIRLKPGLLVTNCHIVFLSASAIDQIEQILSIVRVRPILTIGESQNFIAAGGVIQLVQKKDALQFEVGPNAARKAGLTLSSKLLALAKIAPEKRRP